MRMMTLAMILAFSLAPAVFAGDDESGPDGEEEKTTYASLLPARGEDRRRDEERTTYAAVLTARPATITC